MNHGLLAPQFGLGRIGSPDTAAAEWPSARDGKPSAGSSATGPTVIFKRRRLLECPETVFVDAAVSTMPHKAPRVHRLASIACTTTGEAHVQPTQLACDAPAERATATASTTLRKLRRRRDPTRLPTLLQHIVIERPAESHSAKSDVEQGDADRVDIMSVRRCLKQLDAALAEAARAQEAFRALDEHLRALGIPGSAA